MSLLGRATASYSLAPVPWDVRRWRLGIREGPTSSSMGEVALRHILRRRACEAIHHACILRELSIRKQKPPPQCEDGIRLKARPPVGA